jgi:predicted transcriptional regulator
MPTENAEVFDDYWRAITRAEDFICQYGHTADPCWETRASNDLQATYETVRPMLAAVSGQRMIYTLPRGLNAFAAENLHHALVMVLNPPERWFGRISILDSSEYHILKGQVEKEERRILAAFEAKWPTPESCCDSPDLNETELDILEAMDEQPRPWAEIAKRAGYESHTVRRYSKRFQAMGLIKKTRRGFIRDRVVSLHCEEVRSHERT